MLQTLKTLVSFCVPLGAQTMGEYLRLTIISSQLRIGLCDKAADNTPFRCIPEHFEVEPSSSSTSDRRGWTEAQDSFEAEGW